MLLLLTTVTDAQGIDLNVIRKVRRISCGFDILRKKTGKTCGSNAIESSFNTFQFRKEFRERVTNARLNRSREFREIPSYSREVLVNIVSRVRGPNSSFKERTKTGKAQGSNAIESSFNTFQFRKKFRERVTNARLNRSREFREISSYSREVLLNIVSHSRSVDLTKTQRERFLPFLH